MTSAPESMPTHRKYRSSGSDRSKAGAALLDPVKQIEERGGKWQPITGGVEEGETLEKAARREIREETGLAEVDALIHTEYSFTFYSRTKGLTMHEHVFGARMASVSSIRLSTEHTDYKWLSKDEAMNHYLDWMENKNALLTFVKNLSF